MIAFPTLAVAENVAIATLQLQSLTICARLAAATRDLTVRENTATAVNLNRNTGKSIYYAKAARESRLSPWGGCS